MKNRNLRDSLEKTIRTAVRRCKQIAWIGYKEEGLTILHLLRRAGCWDVADCVESHFKEKYPRAGKTKTPKLGGMLDTGGGMGPGLTYEKALARLTLEEVAATPVDKFKVK